jgi:hypothetical protein
MTLRALGARAGFFPLAGATATVVLAGPDSFAAFAGFAGLAGLATAEALATAVSTPGGGAGAFLRLARGTTGGGATVVSREGNSGMDGVMAGSC